MFTWLLTSQFSRHKYDGGLELSRMTVPNNSNAAVPTAYISPPQQGYIISVWLHLAK